MDLIFRIIASLNALPLFLPSQNLLSHSFAVLEDVLVSSHPHRKPLPVCGENVPAAESGPLILA
jgi:hypothetical protein